MKTDRELLELAAWHRRRHRRREEIMPVVTCPNCGATTNTAVATAWWEPKEARCTGKFVDGKWERGCGYDTAPDFDKAYVDKLIRGNP